MGSDDIDAKANKALPSASVVSMPSKSIRAYCLGCCNNSAHEVNLCPATSCSLWAYRFGPAPTADMLEEAGDALMYPVEDGPTVAEFFEKGGTRLKAIKRKCFDCSGGSKSEVRNCWDEVCSLHPFRLGHNPSRAMSPEQREAAASRLKANIERAKAAASVDGRNSPTHVGENAEATHSSVQSEHGRLDRKSRRETALIGKK
jgi:hypothetical protein